MLWIEMAVSPVTIAKLCAPWKSFAADGHGVRAARMKAAAAGRRDQAGDVATRLKLRLLKAS